MSGLVVTEDKGSAGAASGRPVFARSRVVTLAIIGVEATRARCPEIP